MPFITQGKANLKYILVVVFLAAIVGGGVLGYQYWWAAKKEITPPEIKPSINEITNWITYRNEKSGFEIDYPKGWHSYKDEEMENEIISTLSEGIYEKGDVYEEFGEDYALIYIEHWEDKSLNGMFEKRKEGMGKLESFSQPEFAPKEIIIESINMKEIQGYRIVYREEAGVQSGIHFSYLFPGKNNKGVIEFWGWFRGITRERQEEYLDIFVKMLSTFQFLD